MSSLPSNYQKILNTQTETETFEKKWPVIARLLGMDAEVTNNGAAIELSKNDTIVMTIYKAGGVDLYVAQSDEIIKKLMVLAVKEINKQE